MKTTLIQTVAIIVVFSCALTLNECQRQKDRELFESEMQGLSKAYEERLKIEQINFEKAKAAMADRFNGLAQLDSLANDLRMQLSASKSESPAVPGTSVGSDAAAAIYRERIAALEKALAEATVIIKERDECALNYNALKQQCEVYVNGNGNNSNQIQPQ